MYNATLGYGLCTGCRNNSEGDHCEKCVDKYYRDLSKPLNHTAACTGQLSLVYLMFSLSEWTG